MRIEVEQTIHLLRRYKLADHERSLTTRLAAIELRRCLNDPDNHAQRPGDLGRSAEMSH